MKRFLPCQRRLFAGAGAGMLLLAACILGCGGRTGPERAVVSGAVTYDGQPVDDGMIRFIPTGNTKAPVSGAVIKGGQYTADSQGGVPVGTHRVEVEGYKRDAKAPAVEVPGVEGSPPVQYLPPKHNQTSQLTITVSPGSRSMKKDFSLEK